MSNEMVRTGIEVVVARFKCLAKYQETHHNWYSAQVWSQELPRYKSEALSLE